MEEDLIETADQDQGLAGAIELLEDPTGGGGGGLDPAMNAWSDWDMPAVPRRMASKTRSLVEAQAHGQGRDGELLLLGRGELDGLEQPVPELGVLPAEGLVLLDQFALESVRRRARPRRRPGPCWAWS